MLFYKIANDKYNLVVIRSENEIQGDDPEEGSEVTFYYKKRSYIGTVIEIAGKLCAYSL